ncbi:MAG: hypothetical protein OEN00_15055 [Gemmatimonadota bacterium]|nr:hypothetical protein [Gemmatimonadota bacterium]
MLSLDSIAFLHLVATAFMAGAIVFVQVVHYPLMAVVGRPTFAHYEQAHTVRTAWVVGPPMIVELATALWLVAEAMGTSGAAAALAGVALLGVIWVSTAVLQSPAHRRLLKGFDEAVHRRLVGSNWIRTVAWVARVPIAIALVP